VAHRVEIRALTNTGPTDGSADDTLWVAELAEAGRRAEQFRFSLDATYGEPTENEMRDLIRRSVAGLTIEQLHEREEPYGEDPYRRVILLRP
jgi:hypothetical protein